MNKVRSKVLMTDFQKRICELDAESIAYYRNNPCIACEDLLGIPLLDSQKYILQKSWNATRSIWCCSRNFGKSFLGAILMILKAVLYENQAIYIISSVGNQSKETFQKIEEIVLNMGKTSASIKTLRDIVSKEIVKNSNNKDGFAHPPEGYHVEFYNGSEIFTLNSSPNNNRSKRATLVFFDEAAFCSDELISICEAFATQNMDFITSMEDDYIPETEPRRVPTQLVYASSQGEMDKMFYKHYKNFSKKMFAGDREYFVCDMTCDTAIETYMNGKKYSPLLTRSTVDSALKANKEKALREYYNRPVRDGGESQIIKWSMIRNNEAFYLPQLVWTPESKIILAFDPARTYDNSIVSAMNIYQDEDMGLCGNIVNCVNMIDTQSSRKYKLNSNEQIKEIRHMLLAYNGTNPDYEFIDSLLIDSGSGGGGTSAYADRLLNDWKDDSGTLHRGLIDSTHPIYAGYQYKYPNAVDKLKLIDPAKYRTQMVEEFIELMKLGVIKFPYEYNNQESIKMLKYDKQNQETFDNYELNKEEMLALAQIDLMKNEITSIHKTTNSENTKIKYALSKEKENTMHDDRFYTIILLAHRLYELRRENITNSYNVKDDFANYKACVSSVDF